MNNSTSSFLAFISTYEISSFLLLTLFTLSSLYFGNFMINLFIPKNQQIQNIEQNQQEKDNQLKNGKRIGGLERMLYFIGIVSQNWIIVTLVIGLKTISRYQALDKQSKAEYFLIGSLASLFFSIIISYIYIYLIKILNISVIDNIHNLVVHNVKIF